MKGKIMALIFTVAFAAFSATLNFCVASSQTIHVDIDSSNSNGYLLANGDHEGVEPLKEIDTPAMPG